ncbi:MAG: type II secretion system inner membrane protein GspF [Burkholderiaceae bacterium]|jgi:general secretion pathway protein F
MTAFRFEAADPQGEVQSGVLQADSPRSARSTLRKRGLTPLAVEALASADDRGGDAVVRTPTSASRARSGGARLSWRSKLPAQERGMVWRQLASMVTAGLPLAQALLATQEESERESVRDVLAGVRGDVLGGLPFASALARFPREFPDLDRALVAAGEQSGDLGAVLERLADHVERREALLAKVRLAFAYPLIVSFIALSVITGLLTYVVPQIVRVFNQTHQQLPLLTRIMIWLSDLLREDGWLLLIAAVIIFVLVRLAFAQPGVRRAWHAQLLAFPVVGPIVRRTNTVRFADTMAILGTAGVPILRALQASRDTMGNVVMKDQVSEAINRVREGVPLSRALSSQQGARSGFSSVLINLIASGESTGKLPMMLERAAQGQADELERRTMLLTSLLEPILVLTMGGMVLLIVLAILLPIIEINQLVR